VRVDVDRGVPEHPHEHEAALCVPARHVVARRSKVDIALGLGMVGARRGDPAAREHLTRAVELADETDATGHRAELRLEVAESLSSEERGEAISLVREALDLARAKGAVVVERRAEELLARLSG